MAGFTAKDATVKVGANEVLGIEEFTFNDAGNIAVWADNTTGGAMTRAVGAGDSTGTLVLVLDKTRTIPWKFGSTATVIFHVDGDDTGTYTVPLIISSAPMTAQLAGTDQIGIPYEWGATGPVVRAGILAASGA
ncbi:unnamed protein product [marine sediment metagenome]|uniref:Uncharacterized protein n=1 Tax=marine sediment metagenome TaxID=412755 RepID=X0SYU7_9ZZZZ